MSSSRFISRYAKWSSRIKEVQSASVDWDEKKSPHIDIKYPRLLAL